MDTGEEKARCGQSWSFSQIHASWTHNPVSNLIICHSNSHLTSLLSLQYVVFFSSDLEFEDIRNNFFLAIQEKMIFSSFEHLTHEDLRLVTSQDKECDLGSDCWTICLKSYNFPH